MKPSNPDRTDADGHTLTSLWKQYEEASKADRPQKEAEILSKIKAEAQKQHLAVDFYDAARQYVYSVQRRDWKQRNLLREQLAAEVAEFDEPIVTYLWMGEFADKSTEERWAYVQAHAEAFRGVHPSLWRNVDHQMGGALKAFITDDREYVLWNLLDGRIYDDIEKDEVYLTLRDELAGRYPAAGWLAYYRASRLPSEQRKPALEALAGQYAGTALSFWPREDLLQMEFTGMEKEKASSDAFKAFYDRCRAFERERGALKGDESKIAAGCTLVKGLIQTLSSPSLSVRMLEGDIAVLLRNLGQATVTLRNQEGRKVLHTWTAVNPVRSFYVQDTVRIALPSLPDGDYAVEAVGGKHAAEVAYTRHTLSLAARQDARGQAVYVTDYLTGQPLDRATLVLWKGGNRVLSETVKLDGFTVLPKKFQSLLDGNTRVYYALSAETGSGTALRCSPQLSVRNQRLSGNDAMEDGMYAHLYKDRGAYNPGDTVKFKAVLYKGDLVDRVAVVPGTPVTAVLSDSEDKEIERISLKTNSFGSVSGAFALPVGKRNGWFNLRVESGGKVLAYDSFRVDEFVLPTFTLRFDGDDALYLPGDTVSVGGKVQSYTGHSLTGATLAVRVTHYGTVVREMTLTPAQDGTFVLTFPAEDSGYYQVDVQVSDATGETLSFSTARYISDAIRAVLSVRDAADGEFVTLDGQNTLRPVYFRRPWRPGPSRSIVTGNTLRAEMAVDDSNGSRVPVPLAWRLLSEDGTELLHGSVDSGAVVDIDLSGFPSGLYSLKAAASARNAAGKEIRDEAECQVLLLRGDDRVLDAPLRRIFIAGRTDVETGGKIRLQIGTADGPEWVVATLYGKGREVLLTRKLTLEGVRGETGSLTTLELDYLSRYPDAVRLQVFYFKRGEAVSFEREFKRVRPRLELPLTFTRFTDQTFPGTSCTFTLRTDPGVEALAAVYDKSIDAIAPNHWPTVSLREFSVPSVPVNAVCGRVSGEDAFSDDIVLEETMVVGYGSRRMMSKSASVNMSLAMEADMAEDALAAPMAAEGAGPDDGDVPVREAFEAALTFQPHLESDADGNLSFTLRTSDKLSTYYVSVYAHDPAMRNALLREEMVVSLPVKVAVVEPQYLYEGDRYEVAVTVSSTSDKDVPGVLRFTDRFSEPLSGESLPAVQEQTVTVSAGGTVTVRFPVEVGKARFRPVSAGVAEVLEARFVSEAFSDAVRLTVPVLPASQTLTEAHSAVLRAGMDADALAADLRNRFTNLDGSAAVLREISLLNLVREAVPGKVEPSGKDVLSLSEAWYVRKISSIISDEDLSVLPGSDLLEKILACRAADGGFGWFEGMAASPVITAVVLERFAKLRARGFEVPDLTSSVKYLDNNQFTTEKPVWCGWVSDAQYMYVRSLYPEVPFTVSPSSKTGQKRMADFRKAAKKYLVPGAKEGRGLQGQILAKARRVKTLLQLSATSDGLALAKAWGVTVAPKSRLMVSLDADITSLLEYAVEHRDGGRYYPNAVMPWRGLLESEAYAHALLCDLLTEIAPLRPAATGPKEPLAVADGIRLWLMLQKETQEWDEDPAFVDALNAILNGSEAVLSTRILSLTATGTLPFAEIRSAGNGLTIERRFFREVTVEKVYDDRTSEKNDRVTELQEIQPGMPVSVGEKIIAQYRIWNQENRSFVRIDAFREASLRPVQQLSGYSGWGTVRPLRSGASFTFTPQGYRNVKADRTEYWFDSFPEENTTLTEAFFVTQAGTFTAPVVTVESLYAPHYRANAAFSGPLTVQ